MLIERLIGILIDNAVKYCNPNGEISLVLTKRRQTILIIENDYSEVSTLQLDKLFDRFYRGDKARSFHGGYGIGLSMAKSIVDNHKATISVYKKGNEKIGFKVVFKR